MNYLFQVLRAADLFSCQVGLHFNKSSFYKTACGGFFSIVVVICLLIFCWPRITNFYSKESVNVSKDRLYDTNPPHTSVGEDRFMFALQISQPNQDFLTRPFFNVTAIIGIYTNSETQNIYQEVNIELEPCTRRHFEGVKGADFASLYDKVPTGYDALCPVLGQNLFMQGTWSSPTFSYLQFIVKACVTPNDPTKRWNPVCATQEEIDQYIASNGFSGFTIFHTNVELNPDESKSYTTSYINDKYYFTFIPNKMSLITDINFEDISAFTDQSLLPTVEQQLEKILTQQYNDYFQRTEILRGDGVYILATLRLAPYKTQYYRSYKKISQLIGELAGNFQVVIAICAILFRKYNQSSLTLELAKNLDIFEKNRQLTSQRKGKSNSISKKKSSERLKTQNEEAKEHNQRAATRNSYENKIEQIDNLQNLVNINIREETSMVSNKAQIKDFKQDKIRFLQRIKSIFSSQQNTPIIDSQNGRKKELQVNTLDQENRNKKHRKQVLVNNFEKEQIKRRNNRRDQSFYQQVIRLLFCSKKYKGDDESNLKRVVDLVESDLNISKILHQLQETRKLKEILFDHHQLELFNYYPLATLGAPQKTILSEQNKDHKNQSVIEKKIIIPQQQDSGQATLEVEESNKYNDLFQSYLELKKKSSKEQQLIHVNSRLIYSLDKDLLQLLKQLEQIEESEDVSSQSRNISSQSQINSQQMQFEEILPSYSLHNQSSVLHKLDHIPFSQSYFKTKTFSRNPGFQFNSQISLQKLDLQQNSVCELKGSVLSSPLQLNSMYSLQKQSIGENHQIDLDLEKDFINLNAEEIAPQEGNNYKEIMDNMQKYRLQMN